MHEHITPTRYVLPLREGGSLPGLMEADEEAQDLLTASVELNLASDFLPGSFAFDDASKIGPDESAKVLWLDLLIGNPDRTWRNPNLLMWHRDVWCIDHEAAFYVHHGWGETVDPAKLAGIGRDPRHAREIYRDYLAVRLADPNSWIAGLR